MLSHFVISFWFIAALAVDLPPPPSVPACTDVCADNYAVGWGYEAYSWVSTDIDREEFYTAELPCGAVPGDLIKWEDVSQTNAYSNWTIPGGMSLSRFLYVSEDPNGQPILASSFVLLPFNAPRSQDKLRTLVWAHGTAGRARICAPSNHRTLYYDWAGPLSIALAGYAVIAPDYAGLGTVTPRGFMYEAGVPHAADVAFGLVAVRKRLGSILTDEYAVIGQSEGGMTAWRYNERINAELAHVQTGTFLGSVAIAPANRPLAIMELLYQNPNDQYASIVGLYVLASIAELYPDDIKMSDYVSPTVIDRLDLINSACVFSGYQSLADLSLGTVFTNTSWITHPAAEEWRTKYNGEGSHGLAAPMLVITGTADTIVPMRLVAEDVEQTCNRSSELSLEYLIYQGHDHDVLSAATIRDYLEWTDTRFQGLAPPAGCLSSKIEPLFDNFNPIQSVYHGVLL